MVVLYFYFYLNGQIGISSFEQFILLLPFTKDGDMILKSLFHVWKWSL